MTCTTTDNVIQQHNERPAKVWSSGGADYDRISRGIADSIEHAVLRLEPQPHERILDLATGTGWTSRVVSRYDAFVTGVDIAADLLSVARGKAAQERLQIEYRVGDAEQLPLENGEFDAAISTCGVMFASRQEAAAAELARVVRKGGRIALTTWTPEGNVAKMFEVMKRYMPPPPTPAPRSPFEWGKIERVRELLSNDFDLRFERATSFYREPSAEAAWQTFSSGYGPTRTLAAGLEPDRREALRKDFIAFHAAFETELGVCVPRDYLLTVGVRK
jgi:ubiquinone/menaquinone biosynthesis C-methylase UbiE